MVAEKLGAWGGKIAVIGFALAIVAVAAAVASGLGNRVGWWTYREGFAALEWIVYVGAVAAVASGLGAALVWQGRPRRRGTLILALVGVVVGALVVWIPYQGRQALRASPRLADVTTDTANPPVFVAAIEARKKAKARNTTDYSREKAEIQAKSYPDIKPVMLKVSPDEAFDRALRAVNSLGYKLLADDRKTGRIEAVATTFWFGFQDDIVIRVSRAADGAKVDIRSTSRVGAREGGTNAKRVRKLAEMVAEG